MDIWLMLSLSTTGVAHWLATELACIYHDKTVSCNSQHDRCLMLVMFDSVAAGPLL